MTYATRCPDCPSGVNKSLTAKRRYRAVENDEYAAFLRRVIAAYSRRVAAGDIEAITAMAHLADHLEDATRQAITGLRAFGYSWADIALRLGITRQGAQQRWGDAPVPVTDTSSTVTYRSCP
jgi:DNA-directed RNA polymerase specialized sigma24 family protein